MTIKYKVLKDFQLLTDDKKIIILKAKTLLEDYKFKNKSDTVTVPIDIIKNNPDYFAYIDWKEDLQSYLKTNKIPQPAVITKKLLPFIETLLKQFPSQTKEVIVEKEVTKEIIVEKPVTVEKEVIIEKEVNNIDSDLENKLKKTNLLQKQLEKEIDEANAKEAEYIAKNLKLEQKENYLKKQESELQDLSKQLILKSENLNSLENKISLKLSEANSLIKKESIIELLSGFKTQVPDEYQGYFGNSMQSESLGRWYKQQMLDLIEKLKSDDLN